MIKEALSDVQQELLAESQFRQIMLMGGHTFWVMFAHQLLARQLVARNDAKSMSFGGGLQGSP